MRTRCWLVSVSVSILYSSLSSNSVPHFGSERAGNPRKLRTMQLAGELARASQAAAPREASVGGLTLRGSGIRRKKARPRPLGGDEAAPGAFAFLFPAAPGPRHAAVARHAAVRLRGTCSPASHREHVGPRGRVAGVQDSLGRWGSAESGESI